MITQDNIKYVIVQAGGKGTRMGHYTDNKPKCLVPVNDIPILVNNMNIYKNKKIIIIGDYLIDVLDSYLMCFCSDFDYKIIRTNESGTSAGLKKAVSYIPDREPFIITWSDLFFEKEQNFILDSELLVGLSNTFECRWKFDEGFKNISSNKCGVSGFFVFEDKVKFKNLTTEKSFVRGFLCDNYTTENINTFYNHDCFEVGEKKRYEEILSKKVNHRYFNKVEIDGNVVRKKCIDSKYDNLHQNEKDWYEFVNGKFDRIPKIYSTDPLVIEKIIGKHLWEVSDNKKQIIENYCDALDQLHSIDKKPSEKDGMSVYFSKAYKRVYEVMKIIPHSYKPYIMINGKYCRNPIYDLSYFEDIISSMAIVDEYNVIHGDCSFSNTLVDNDGQIWFIDPRGSFGATKIYGDRRYDWAKLYYSVSGNYDSINSKKFKVKTFGEHISLAIQSNGFEEYSDLILERSGMSEKEMLIINATIWLSLTGYVKEDIDAAMYAFYRGCEVWTQATTLI